MFRINKKMMLCAAIGGSVDDYNRMLSTELITLRCPHVDREKETTSATIVSLRQFRYESENIGYVGRCENCGKIYFKGAI